ncbi:integrin alpha-8 [Cricetulus griseus]|uniref:Integrin alpha-8 n=1 Tax=Cricetulus griseus TaxID=10029 RepID=A0A061IG39_CRIGR|nr:integrin alpha-8 [Cricetulus griseus]
MKLIGWVFDFDIRIILPLGNICPSSNLLDKLRKNNRKIRVNGTKEPIEFKSNQWFGATVRAHKGKVVACAPLYHWRTLKPNPAKDPVGTCYVAIQNFSAYAEHSPCRNSNADPEGQGYCQAGFSLDFYKNGDLIVGGPGSFYWQGQVITVSIADIIANYSFKDILRKLAGEKQTDVAPASYDDSYLGYSVAAGEFTGDSQQEIHRIKTEAMDISTLIVYRLNTTKGDTLRPKETHFSRLSAISESDNTFEKQQL